MRRLWPRSLAGQIITALLIALAAAQAVSFAIFASERRQAIMSARREQVIQRTASLVRMLEHSPDHQHGEMLASLLGAANSARLRFWVDEENAVPIEAPENRDNRLVRALATLLDEPEPRPILVEIRDSEEFLPVAGKRFWRRMHRHWDDDDDHEEHHRHWGRFRGSDSGPGYDGGGPRHPLNLAVSVSLHSGQWLNAEMAVPPPRGWALPSLVAMVLMAVAICAITVLVVRRLTRPLADLAGAADALGRGEPVPPVAARGPQEVRRTTEAFNRMQERIHRFVSDRTAMLAAVSHDLRTPLTSLRLRAEFITGDAENKRKILETLDELERITKATLEFARDDSDAEPIMETDIVALVDVIVNEFSDIGKDVRLEPSEAVTLACRPTALRRAIRNLVKNAVDYGQRARLRVNCSDAEVCITIEDDGPGIRESDREKVFEPFTRLETSRSRETGGVGLGLAIARSILRSHGGDIHLANIAGGGLRAVAILPLPQGSG